MYSAQQSNLVSAYGDFISQWPWDHYATLTFGRKLSQASCLRHWDDFIDSLGRNTRGRVGWVLWAVVTRPSLFICPSCLT